MQLGRVIGTVVATERVEGTEGLKLLLVQPLDKHRRPRGGAIVAADAVAMAGVGELVYVVASREAALACPQTFVPVDHAITGIVDRVDLENEVANVDLEDEVANVDLEDEVANVDLEDEVENVDLEDDA